MSSIGLEDAFKLKMKQYCKRKELGNQLKSQASLFKKEKAGCGKGRRELKEHKQGKDIQEKSTKASELLREDVGTRKD